MRPTLIGCVLLFCYASLANAKDRSLFPKDLESFFGKPPVFYSHKLLPQAKRLRRMMTPDNARMSVDVETQLKQLARTSDFADYANYLLAQAYAMADDHLKSLQYFRALLSQYPQSPLVEEAKQSQIHELLELGIQKSKGNGGDKKFAQTALIQGLELLPWKDWEEQEDAIDALLTLLEKAQPELYDAYLTEALLALPPTSNLRATLLEDLSPEEIKGYTQLAKYRTVAGQAGVKPVSPDGEMFDDAMGNILHKKWDDAKDILDKLLEKYPQSEHLERVHFWLARCLGELGKKEESEALFSTIWAANPLSYYGLQSAEILGKDPLSIAKGKKPENWPQLEGSLLPRQLLGIWKTRALLEAGLPDFARLEAESLFNYRPNGIVLGQASPQGALAMAEFYAAASFYLGAFSNAYAAANLEPGTISQFSLDFFYPKAFWRELNEAAESSGVHPLLLLSLTKQESGFNPRALSRSDAYGLMQLLPSTARELNIIEHKRDLLQPSLNTILGAKYLRGLLDRFNGNIALSLAAYNAGPNRAAQWQQNLATMELFQGNFPVDAFIDSIPFTETRKYVASILRNYTWYKLMNKDEDLIPIQRLAFLWQINPNPAK